MSPQYVIWLFPFVPFYKKATIIKFTAIVMITITIFPGWYHLLLEFNPIGIILVNLRTVLFIWMLSDLLKSLGAIEYRQVQVSPTTSDFKI